MVERKNILVVPADCAAARVVIDALKYEKSAQLVLQPQHQTPKPVPGAICLPPMEKPSREIAASLLARGVDLVFVFDAGWRDCLAPYAEEQGIPLLPAAAPSLPVPGGAAPASHACYTNQSGEVIYCAAIAFSGEGSGRHSVASPHIVAQAKGLAQRYSLRGGWCFTPDMAPEAASITLTPSESWTLHRLAGVNLAALSLFEAGGHPVGVIPPLGQHVLASAEGFTIGLDRPGTIFLDLDDTLLVHGDVHDAGLDFLARATAQGAPVHLITRHFQEPEKTLAVHGIDTRLFAHIHWLTDGTPKSRVIAAHQGAMFIDDSFKERREVRDALGIPVFAPDVLAHLLR